MKIEQQHISLTPFYITARLGFFRNFVSKHAIAALATISISKNRNEIFAETAESVYTFDSSFVLLTNTSIPIRLWRQVPDHDSRLWVVQYSFPLNTTHMGIFKKGFYNAFIWSHYQLQGNGITAKSFGQIIIQGSFKFSRLEQAKYKS